jgi:hypothetical protein
MVSVRQDAVQVLMHHRARVESSESKYHPCDQFPNILNKRPKTYHDAND